MEGVYKVCPRCGEEYQYTASRCADCDVDLVAPGDAPSEGEAFPEAASLVCLRIADPGWIGRLSERFTQNDLPHRIEPAAESSPNRFGIYVRPEDEARARELDELHIKEEIPELTEADGPEAPCGEGCPACGDAVPEAATECPGCGLVILS